MTFFTDVTTAQQRSPFQTHDFCLQCGKPSSGPTVAWDMYLSEGHMRRVLFHRDCAMTMSLGMICDAHPNRGARAQNPEWP